MKTHAQLSTDMKEKVKQLREQGASGRLRLRRIRVGVTIEEVATRAGLTQSTGSRIETGASVGRGDTLIRWDEALRAIEQGGEDALAGSTK